MNIQYDDIAIVQVQNGNKKHIEHMDLGLLEAILKEHGLHIKDCYCKKVAAGTRTTYSIRKNLLKRDCEILCKHPASVCIDEIYIHGAYHPGDNLEAFYDNAMQMLYTAVSEQNEYKIHRYSRYIKQVEAPVYYCWKGVIRHSYELKRVQTKTARMFY